MLTQIHLFKQPREWNNKSNYYNDFSKSSYDKLDFNIIIESPWLFKMGFF